MEETFKKAEEIFGYDNVNIPTLTRPWIVPGEIIIHETENSAYIYKATTTKWSPSSSAILEKIRTNKITRANIDSFPRR